MHPFIKSCIETFFTQTTLLKPEAISAPGNQANAIDNKSE